MSAYSDLPRIMDDIKELAIDWAMSEAGWSKAEGGGYVAPGGYATVPGPEHGPGAKIQLPEDPRLGSASGGEGIDMWQTTYEPIISGVDEVFSDFRSFPDPSDFDSTARRRTTRARPSRAARATAPGAASRPTPSSADTSTVRWAPWTTWAARRSARSATST